MDRFIVTERIPVEDLKYVEKQARLVNKEFERDVDLRAAWRSINEKRLLPGSTSLSRRESVVNRFVRGMQSALEKRENRVQAQMPFKGRSILAFWNDKRNEALLNLMLHWRVGHPALRMECKEYSDSNPFFLPKSWTEERVNAALKRVFDAYNRVPGATADAWVEDKRALLDALRRPLGLARAEFRPFQLQHPYVPDDGTLLLWHGYHTTRAFAVDAQGERIQIHNRFMRPFSAAFMDCVPRSLFSERVWRIFFALHGETVVDVGGGSRRGSQWTQRFCAEPSVPTTEQDARFTPDLLQYLGAPLVDDDRSQRRTAELLTDRHLRKLSARGFLQVHRVIPDDVYNGMQEDFRAFLQRFMLEDEGIDAHLTLDPRTVDDVKVWSAIFGGRNAARTIFGNEFAFYKRLGQRRYKHGREVKIPASIGLGIGTSCFGGRAHLLAQAMIARDVFRHIYGEPVVVVPERYRVKVAAEWSGLHIDHAPLSMQVRDAVAAFVARTVEHAVERPSSQPNRPDMSIRTGAKRRRENK